MFFDLDETLYPHTTGIWQAIGLRMDRYIIDQLKIAPEAVTDLRNNLFHQYGTTLRGLREVYGINEGEFLTYVHDIPIDLFLQKDQALIDTLSLFTQRKVIFTNADTNHAKRVMDQLGIYHFFNQVIDIQAIHPYCKPMAEAFTTALSLANITNPGECVMIDDSERNLFTAHELGFYTIQVGASEHPDYVDAAVKSVYELPDVIPA